MRRRRSPAFPAADLDADNFSGATQANRALLNETALPFRKQLMRYLVTSGLGQSWDLLTAVLAIVSCLLYVAETYLDDDTPTLMLYADMGIAALFVFDYALRLYLADNRLRSMTSWAMVVDLVSIVPSALGPFVDEGALRALRVARVLRVLRLTRLHRVLSYFSSEIKQQVLKIFLTLSTIVTVAAGLIQLVEEGEQDLRYHEWVYFIIVTLATVGYGDISPMTSWGMFVVSMMILATIVLVPKQTNELVRLISAQSRFGTRRYVPVRGTPFVLVCGSVHSRAAQSFFLEFFHDDHPGAHDAVLLARGNPSPALEELLSAPVPGSQMTYLDGSPLIAADLARACAAEARSFFVLANKFSLAPDAEDSTNVLRAMAIKQFVQRVATPPPTCVQLIRPANAAHFQRTRGGSDSVVCVSELKLSLMAKSTLCPGICPLVFNLIGSSSDDAAAPASVDAAWQAEYARGASQELYAVRLAPFFRGRPFVEAAVEAYRRCDGALLIALAVNDGGGGGLAVNPGGFRVPANGACTGYCIAADHRQASMLSLVRDDGSVARPDPHSASSLTKAAAVAVSASLKDMSMPRVPIALPSVPSVPSVGSSAPGGVPVVRQTVLVGPSRARTLEQRREAADRVAAQREAALQHKPSGGLWAKVRDRVAPSERYFLLDQPRPLQEAVVHVFSEAALRAAPTGAAAKGNVLAGHVLVTGSAAGGLAHLVRPLRLARLKRIRPIVLLTDKRPSVSDWQHVARFPLVFVVEGSPLDEGDLLRAGVRSASRAVLLANVLHTQSTSDADSREALSDADTIFARQAIAALSPLCRITAEIIHGHNVCFLSNGETAGDVDVAMAPPFAAGGVYSSGINDLLLAQAYWNPAIVTLVRHFIAGGPADGSSSSGELSMCDSTCYQVPLEAAEEGLTWLELLQRRAAAEAMQLCVGLLRAGGPVVRGAPTAGKRGNALPYVITNPPPGTVLERHDRVFVLCREQPLAASQGDGALPLSADLAARLAQAVSAQRAIAKDPAAVLRDVAQEMQLKLDTLQGATRAMQTELARVRQANLNFENRVASLVRTTVAAAVRPAVEEAVVSALAWSRAEAGGARGQVAVAEEEEEGAEEDEQEEKTDELARLEERVEEERLLQQAAERERRAAEEAAAAARAEAAEAAAAAAAAALVEPTPRTKSVMRKPPASRVRGPKIGAVRAFKRRGGR